MSASKVSASRHGLARGERRDPTGVAVAALTQLAQSPLLDRLGLRERVQQAVSSVTSAGFRGAVATQRQLRSFTRKGGSQPGLRPSTGAARGEFDLTPTDDEQMLADVAREFAADVLRPAAAAADDTLRTAEETLAGAAEIGLHLIGVPESLGGIAEERSAVATALVLEALAHGDMGQAVATMSTGAVATALSLWGTDEQQQTYLSALTCDGPAVASLVLTEPSVLFDAMSPAATAERRGEGFVLNGIKTLAPRAADAALLLVGATLDGEGRLFVIEAGTPGVTITADPAMGLRAAATARIELDDVAVEAIALVGSAEDYRACVRSSRLAWCALAVGTGQAVLDYVTPYVKERQAFGEPVAHRQSVAFMVANIAIELEAMRLATLKASARLARGKDAAREIALARRLCADKGMQIGLDGVQLLGGHGFVKEHPVERWYRDLRAVGVLEGGVLI